MFRERPSLAAELLTVACGPSMPAFDDARIGAGELTPIEHRADTVVELRAKGKLVLAVVVEVQLSRDPVKHYSWPVYLTSVRSRLRCPSAVLVLCSDAATAAWCAKPVPLGPGNTFTPVVLGPRQIPVLVDADEAVRNPELATLSTMAHGAEPGQDGVLSAFLVALTAVDDDTGALYYDLVHKALSRAALKRLEELMRIAGYEYQSDFARKYVAEGEARGKAKGESEALLIVLEGRGIKVPAEARSRIVNCKDLDQLKVWLRRALDATSIQDVLR